ncbi:protein GOLM2 isoform X2 [Ascaphus truei]|uniref:protein GOLM2 isoform X2 n=1 Tax=Ascaphus truei TaxID=8439 RepID=UPI003F594F06
MAGFGAPRRPGRLPPFVLVVLLAVIGLLAFNYWSVSARQAALRDELLGLQGQVQRSEVARSRTEKRNSELMAQAEGHRRQVEQRQGEYRSLGERLRARDVQAQRCEEDMAKLQNNVSHQMADISRLKGQLAELRHEFLRQEDQLHKYKSNNTLLQKMLQDESQQCRKQVADQKQEYEESLRKLSVPGAGLPHGEEEEVAEKTPSSKEAARESDTETKLHAAATEQREDKEEPPRNLLPYGKDPVGGDGGMPEIEDSDPAKEDSSPTAVKKPDTDEGEVQMSERRPSVRPDSTMEAQDKKVLPAAKKDSALPLGMENTLHLEPLSRQIPKNPNVGVFPNLKQSRFFDENESPVDPQRGSKVADYNGDDGNVEDDDRDGQGDAAEYRKDRFSENL